MTRHHPTRPCRNVFLAALVTACALGLSGRATGDELTSPGKASYDRLWRQSIEQIDQGEFGEAAKTLRTLPRGTSPAGKVLSWLDEYERTQSRRLEMDRADFEKYVGYAKARMERKEYALALDKALLALDVAIDRDAFLQEEWLQKLANDALEQAAEFREERNWRKAWHIYADLGALFEREPRYAKLEREVQTHWRLDTMFEEERDWKDQLEKVRWEDAETALECIEHYYVKPADFRALCESGLEQLLILAESKSAQETFEGLGNEDDRHDFEARIRQRLQRVRQASSVSRRDCVRHFRRVVTKINKQTVRLPDALLVSELMRGALEPLDDYTTIIWPVATEEFDKHTRGDFIGVGISIVKNRTTDEIEVVSPLEDSPAYRAGVHAGDVILRVNGKSLKGYSLTKVVRTITGPKGSEVNLTLRRDGTEIEFPLRRDLIKIQSVKGVQRDAVDEARWNHWLDRNAGIAYIRLSGFQRNTAEDVENLLSELQADGLRGLILDLRGNPGGLLDSAWNISKLFLKAGDTVVSTKGRDRSENQTFRTHGDGAYSDLPVAVLADEGSASASEIVAGAVRDNDRGTVVGTRTFGKFSVQNLIPLGRSNAKLKITTAKYFLPSGVSLHRDPDSEEWGVEPDIPVRLVRKEKINLYKIRRDAQVIGVRPDPDKEPSDEAKDKDAAPDASGDGTEKAKGLEPADAAEHGDIDKPGDTDASGDADEAKDGGDDDGDEEANGLPPLEQPDENERPDDDPQLDAALLVLRAELLGLAHPTLATAHADEQGAETAKP